MSEPSNTCVFCGDPVEGYSINAGGGLAHEDPCTDLECECGHGAEDHGDIDEPSSLACQFEEAGSGVSASRVFRCDCPRWRPVKETP